MKQQFGTHAAQSKVDLVKTRLVDDTKSAVVEGVEIAAGAAALAVLRSFVVPAKMSLVDKFTGKGAIIKKVVNSPIGSFVLAAAANTGVTLFAPNNRKLHRITQLALKASIVELTQRIDIQAYTDALADKLFGNKAVAAVFDNVEDKKDA